MDLRIGFVDNSRELQFKLGDDKQDALAKGRAALAAGTGIVEFVDAEGTTFLLQASRIAYLAVGAETKRSVGFSPA